MTFLFFTFAVQEDSSGWVWSHAFQDAEGTCGPFCCLFTFHCWDLLCLTTRVTVCTPCQMLYYRCHRLDIPVRESVRSTWMNYVSAEVMTTVFLEEGGGRGGGEVWVAMPLFQNCATRISTRFVLLFVGQCGTASGHVVFSVMWFVQIWFTYTMIH